MSYLDHSNWGVARKVAQGTLGLKVRGSRDSSSGHLEEALCSEAEF